MVRMNSSKLSKYSNFYHGETQQDTFEWGLLLIGILDNGFVPYSTDEHLVN